MRALLEYTDLGRMSWARAYELQRALLAERQAAAPDDDRCRMLLVEHDPPVLTLGRRARSENILVPRETLEARGVEIHEIKRGGDVTFHGPGQLVVYPILRLDPRRRTIHGYIRDLEETVIRLLARFGVEGTRRESFTGVWVGDEKVAAIGVGVSKWVAYHGLALNVARDLWGFDLIVPCGIRGHGVTSLSRLLDRDFEMSEARRLFVDCMREVFEFENVREVSLEEIDPPKRRRLPPWLRRNMAVGANAAGVKELLDELGLSTVCSSAHCPNLAECFEKRTATFMILGERCTRACRFCAVETERRPPPPRKDEPEAVAEAVRRLNLRHVVITSVTRDDLPDGGAGHFARVCRAVRERLPEAVIEILTPDFQGDPAAVEAAVEGRPDIFNHNIETVQRLYKTVRPQADYRRSLDVLELARRLGERFETPLFTKSGVMVGMGESREELRRLMADLRRVGCDILTVGQYLAPSTEHHPVARFVDPDEFEEIRVEALRMGFRAVASGPLVRSSYNAEGLFRERK